MDFAAYSVIFDYLSVPVLVTRRDGRIVYVNPAYEVMSGYRSGELLGETPAILRSGETPVGVYKDLWARVSNGDVWRGRFRNIRKDGKPFNVSAVIVPILDPDGLITELVSVQENLDLRPRGDPPGNEEAGLLHEVATHVPGVILQFRLYPDGRTAVPFASGSIAAFFECTAAELRQNAEALIKRIHSEDLPRLLRSLVSSAKHSREWAAEFRVVLADNKLRWYLVKAMPERLTDGSWLLHGYISDITKRKEAEKALERFAESMRAQNAILAKAQHEAGQASRAKSQFLANIGHEFRTPMNGVLGAVSLLRDTETSVEQKEYLDILQNAAESLVRVIEGILDFSRLDSRQSQLIETTFRPQEMLTDVAAVVGRAARQKGLSFRLEVRPAAVGIAHGDTNVLRQILLNLGLNAIKFTEKGGVVMRLDRLSQCDQGGRPFFDFLISDTGPGIPLEKRELIFQPFTQVDDSATRAHGGAGMGLAICREMVRRMGGEVSLESHPGRGSDFRVRVPLSFQADSESGAAFAPESNSASGAESPSSGDFSPAVHILCVENHPVDKRREALRATSFIVDCASDAAEALIALSEADYDLVLIDYDLPHMDGFELATQIRAGMIAVRNKEIPVFALVSPTADAETYARCREVGVNEILVKPMDPFVLSQLVRRCIRRN
jgi:PAS domain S-box-containing protein